MKHNRIIALSLALVTILSLAGCGKKETVDPLANPLLQLSKEELIEKINTAENLAQQYNFQLGEAQKALEIIQSEQGPSSAITELSDGSKRKTFNKVDGEMTLGVDFKYPESTQAASSSTVKIGGSVEIAPTSNWTCVMNGSSVNLYHESGAYGTISIGYIERQYQNKLTDELQEHLESLLVDMGAQDKRISRIFLGGKKYGVDNISNVFVDGGKAVMRCGILGYGDLSLQYVFIYEGEQNSVKDEIVLSIIKATNVWQNALSIE